MGDNGGINASIVLECCNEINKFTNALIVLKSTVTPDIVKKLSVLYNKFVYNPEFLTEKNANEDCVNQFMLVLGGGSHAQEASFVKYGINTFLATKVTFFNQLYDIVKDNDANFNNIISAIGSDPRITHSHTTVPGFDNKRGYGGACFPKDTTAFDTFAKTFTLLSNAISINTEYRKNYKLDKRELEQNITFKEVGKKP